MASTWEIKGMPNFSKLTMDTTAEVVIVGGGLAGLWCAYLLGREGKHVVLLEKNRLGSGMTGATTAFLTQSIDTSLTDLVKMLGPQSTRSIWQAHGEAIDEIERVVKREGIKCEFVRVPHRMYAIDEDELDRLNAEHGTMKRLGFPSQFVRTPFEGFKNLGGLILRKQAKYHPMKFINGLARAAVENGAEIFENTEVARIERDAVLSVVTKDGHIVRTKSVIVATYDPFNNSKEVHFKKGMYESYVYELHVKHGSLQEGTYEDNENPYHFFRVDSGTRFDRVIVGGEDHRSELTKQLEKKSFKALQQFTKETFSGLEYSVMNKWRGSILEPTDGIALIGRYAPREYLAAAFSGNGMTYSVIAGVVICDLICKRHNPYSKIFDPRRKLNKKAIAYKFRDYSEEFFHGAGKNIFK